MANHIVVTVKDRKNVVPREDHVEYSILFRILLEWLTKEIFPRSACTRVTDILLVGCVCGGCKH